MVPMMSVYRVTRLAQLRSRIEASRVCPGSSSAPQGVCTWMMGAGAIGALIGLFVFWPLALLGATVLVVGFVVALVEAVMDV